MSDFVWPISCLACGGILHLRQSAVHAGTEMVAVFVCGCGREWRVNAFLRPIRVDADVAAREREQRRQRAKAG